MGCVPPVGDVLANTEVVEQPSAFETVAWVDDVVTYGTRMAGMNVALDRARSIKVRRPVGICIGLPGDRDGIDG